MRRDMGNDRHLHRQAGRRRHGLGPDQRRQGPDLPSSHVHRGGALRQEGIQDRPPRTSPGGSRRPHKGVHGRPLHPGADHGRVLRCGSPPEHQLLLRPRHILPLLQGPHTRPQDRRGRHRIRRLRPRRRHNDRRRRGQHDRHSDRPRSGVRRGPARRHVQARHGQGPQRDDRPPLRVRPQHRHPDPVLGPRGDGGDHVLGRLGAGRLAGDRPRVHRPPVLPVLQGPQGPGHWDGFDYHVPGDGHGLHHRPRPLRGDGHNILRPGRSDDIPVRRDPERRNGENG